MDRKGWLDEWSQGVKDMMTARNISTRELSKLAGIPERSLRRYLSGERCPDGYQIRCINMGLDGDIAECSWAY